MANNIIQLRRLVYTDGIHYERQHENGNWREFHHEVLPLAGNERTVVFPTGKTKKAVLVDTIKYDYPAPRHEVDLSNDGSVHSTGRETNYDTTIEEFPELTTSPEPVLHGVWANRPKVESPTRKPVIPAHEFPSVNSSANANVERSERKVEEQDTVPSDNCPNFKVKYNKVLLPDQSRYQKMFALVSDNPDSDNMFVVLKTRNGPLIFPHEQFKMADGRQISSFVHTKGKKGTEIVRLFAEDGSEIWSLPCVAIPDDLRSFYLEDSNRDGETQTFRFYWNQKRGNFVQRHSRNKNHSGFTDSSNRTDSSNGFPGTVVWWRKFVRQDKKKKGQEISTEVNACVVIGKRCFKIGGNRPFRLYGDQIEFVEFAEDQLWLNANNGQSYRVPSKNRVCLTKKGGDMKESFVLRGTTWTWNNRYRNFVIGE